MPSEEERILSDWGIRFQNIVAAHPLVNEYLFNTRYRIAAFVLDEARLAIDELIRQQDASVKEWTAEIRERKHANKS